MKKLTLSCLFIVAYLFGQAYANPSSSSIHDLENQGYENLFFAPGMDRFRVECDVSRTIHVQSGFAQRVLDGESTIFGPHAREHFGESWLRQQLETRSQTYRQVLSVDDGVWIREVIAEAGPLFPRDHHLINIVDFNSEEWTFLALSSTREDGTVPSRTHPLSGVPYSSLHQMAFTTLTFGELLGRSEALPLYLKGTGATQSQTLDGFTSITRYVNPSDEVLAAEIEEDSQGRLLRAAYWESAGHVARELVYGEYISDPESGVEYPSEVTMKRYRYADIELLTPEALVEEITIHITDLAANY